ncbi:MAG: GreA/GreB family elongation factor, partial [Christensenella sp.]
YDKEYDEEIEYKIVGSAETDMSNNKISNESPVGRALIGKKVGNTVKVEAPGGVIKLKILDIHR